MGEGWGMSAVPLAVQRQFKYELNEKGPCGSTHSSEHVSQGCGVSSGSK